MEYLPSLDFNSSNFVDYFYQMKMRYNSIICYYYFIELYKMEVYLNIFDLKLERRVYDEVLKCQCCQIFYFSCQVNHLRSLSQNYLKAHHDHDHNWDNFFYDLFVKVQRHLSSSNLKRLWNLARELFFFTMTQSRIDQDYRLVSHHLIVSLFYY